MTLPTKPAIHQLEHPLPDELPRLFYGLLTLREDGSKRLPDMDHVIPDLEGDIDAGIPRQSRQPGRVIQQGFRRANVNQHRRKPAQIGMDR